MLKGEKVLLRSMKREDIARHHEFDQDIELYGLDSSRPQVSSLAQAETFFRGAQGGQCNDGLFCN